MKLFYTILLFLFLSIGFAQKNKLEGIWIEYKREVAGDTNTSNYAFNGQFKIGDVYQFFKDSTFFYSELGINDYEDINEYYFKKDTLTLVLCARRDYATPILPYIVNQPNSSELILTDAYDSSFFGIKRYFKKIKKLPKRINEKYESIDEPASFPGGLDSLENFLSKNIDTTLLILNRKKWKSVTQINLIIDSDGKIIDAKVPWHPQKKHAKEAIRLARLMPNWIPAKSIQLNSPNINEPSKNVKSEVEVFISINK